MLPFSDTALTFIFRFIHVNVPICHTRHRATTAPQQPDRTGCTQELNAVRRRTKCTSSNEMDPTLSVHHPVGMLQAGHNLSHRWLCYNRIRRHLSSDRLEERSE